jgi:hypothetical protein
MNDKTADIIQKLQAYKLEGLSYYQATQKLLASDYTQTQIDDATAKKNSVNAQNQNNIDTEGGSVNKPNLFTQNYSNTGEMYSSKYSRPALLVLVAIVAVGIIIALLAGLI